MKSLILVALAVFALSGCVVNTPAPASQVTAVASAPARSMEFWCDTEAKEAGKPAQDLGLSFVDDKGDSFNVRSREGKTILVSPKLSVPQSNGMTGYDKLGLQYSKGTKRFAGFYGVFRNHPGGQDYITFNCR